MKPSSGRIWQTAILVTVIVGVILFALSGYMQPFFSTVLSPLVDVQGWLSSRFMAVYEFVTIPRDVASLRDRNAVLEQENAVLQAEIVTLQQQLREAQMLYALLEFSRSQFETQTVAAAVIGKDPSPFLQYVIIDRGSDQGIRYGMPVITERGLVGRVDAVTANASRVQLITDPGAVVNVRIEPSGADGQLSGSVTSEITLGMISSDIIIESSNLVLTSGLGGTFPTDILVGQILGVRSAPNELFQTATIQPAVDFETLQAVLVITNFSPVNIEPLIPD
jgi:rod shape-determining protein MreC